MRTIVAPASGGAALDIHYLIPLFPLFGLLQIFKFAASMRVLNIILEQQLWLKKS
jgi:hypothetical protein